MYEYTTYYTEKFTLVGNGTLPIVFAEWENPADGTNATYTWESTDEGFAGVGNYCIEYTFSEPMDTGANC
jgi:hypothetical protein